MKHHLAGAALSTMIHLAIVLIAFGLLRPKTPEPPPKNLVPVKLSLFQPPVARKPMQSRTPHSPIEQPPKKQKKQIKPKPKPKPKPKIKPRPAVPVKPKMPEFTPESRELPVSAPLAERPQVTSRKAPVSENIDELNKITRDYQTALQSGIEANKHYPRRARRSRQQGRCVVAFTVLQNGHIEGIHITESSGSKALDQASVAAVRSIDGQYPIPPKLSRSRWLFRIPVQYQLR